MAKKAHINIENIDIAKTNEKTFLTGIFLANHADVYQIVEITPKLRKETLAHFGYSHQTFLTIMERLIGIGFFQKTKRKGTYRLNPSIIENISPVEPQISAFKAIEELKKLSVEIGKIENLVALIGIDWAIFEEFVKRAIDQGDSPSKTLQNFMVGYIFDSARRGK